MHTAVFFDMTGVMDIKGIHLALGMAQAFELHHGTLTPGVIGYT
jgi:hypothetical protein